MTDQQTKTAAFECRSCATAGPIASLADAAREEGTGRSPLIRILDLGDQPLANRLLTAEQLREVEPRYPLDLILCRRCGLLQISETVPPEVLFRDYVYFSSYSDAYLEHAAASACGLIAERSLGTKSLVIEAASNDGYLLRNFVAKGIPVLGIEPARNVAEVARRAGIPTISEFFGTDLARQLCSEGKRADLFLANNVLAHVPALNDFVAAIHQILNPNGIAVIEVPYSRPLIEHREFDTIYHEHLSYFSVTSLDALFRRHGLALTRVVPLAVHGGSLRLFLSPSAEAPVEESVRRFFADEAALGLSRLAYYQDFATKVAELKQELRRVLGELKAGGKRIAGYGAAAKGSTLLNFADIGTETLDYIVDRNPQKHGRYLPGVHIPILPVHTLEDQKPDVVMILTWNFAEEILEQLAPLRSQGCRFLIPIPDVRFA